MTEFTLHTPESAPESSRPLLQKSLASFGMIPNLHATMAESPSLLDAYQQVHHLFSKSSFDAEELTVVWQTINVEHECHYCVPGHTAVAHMMKVDPKLNEALRNEETLSSPKLEALRTFTLDMLRSRGQVSQQSLETFFAAGYENKHVLDVILGLSQKVMSNYVNHVAKTPVDEPFQKFAWQRKSKVGA